MKQFYLYFFIFFYSFSSFANKDSIVSFSNAVKKNIKQYISYSNKAYSKKDYIKATYLYDSLVSNTLIGTQFDDFSFKRIGKKKLQLAGIAMTRRRKMEATSLLNEAKKLDKQNMLKDQIKMMKDQMKKM